MLPRDEFPVPEPVFELVVPRPVFEFVVVPREALIFPEFPIFPILPELLMPEFVIGVDIAGGGVAFVRTALLVFELRAFVALLLLLPAPPPQPIITAAAAHIIPSWTAFLIINGPLKS